MNRCFDINDVLIKRPGKHPLNSKQTYNKEMANIAKKLINNDNIFVCRDTGVRFADKTQHQVVKYNKNPALQDNSRRHRPQIGVIHLELTVGQGQGSHASLTEKFTRNT